MDISLSLIAAACAAVFVATVAQALTGFGFALVLVPLLSLVWDPRSVVVVSTILGVLLSTSLAIHARRHVSFPKVGLMLAGGLAGIPLGVAIITGVSISLLKVLIGASVIVLGALIYFGALPPIRRKRSPLLVAGFLSGVLASATSMGGPPVVLCLAGQDHTKESMRATLLAYFGPLGALSVVGLWSGGLVHTSEVLVSLASLPALALGMWLGSAIFGRVPEQGFRAMVAVLIGVTGILSVATGLRG